MSIKERHNAHMLWGQVRFYFRRKEAGAAWLFILIMILTNGILLVHSMSGSFVQQAPSLLKVCSIASGRGTAFAFMLVYPLLVVIPTAGAFLHDYNSKELIYVCSRVTVRKYLYSQLLAGFLVTFCIFTVPFLLEACIYRLVIPAQIMSGDSTGLSMMDVAMYYSKTYFMSGLYDWNEMVYHIVMILIFGGVSGLLAVFNISLGYCSFMRKRIFTFVPIYVLLWIIQGLGNILPITFDTNYILILQLYENTSDWNIAWYLAFLAALLLATICNTEYALHRDIAL